MSRVVIMFLFSCVAFLGNSVQGAITISFDSLTTAGSSFEGVPAVYSEQGYTLTVTSNDANSPLFATWQTGNANYTGSAALFSQFGGHTITLTKDDSTAFDFQSINISESTNPASAAAMVNFVGTPFGGGTNLTQSFTSDNSFGNQTVLLPTFTNLSSVTWMQSFNNPHQFDDIVLNAVPEPGSLLLLSLAGTAVAFRRRKSRR